jgi:hypothetical protein
MTEPLEGRSNRGLRREKAAREQQRSEKRDLSEMNRQQTAT